MNSSSFEGVVLDPSKCSKLSVEEKRELVYELSDWSSAPEMLQSWSRQEILQILCAEMGKERKYTGLTKLKIIENLLKIVSEKKLQGQETVTNLDLQSSPAVGQRSTKRQRKADQPHRLPVAANDVLNNSGESDVVSIIYCENVACRAKLTEKGAFCKRCSCCICYQYDENKDPSLWLTCSSEPPFQGDSCGMSCHLECSLRHEKSGIAEDGMDGSFFCVSCGKVNDLLGCWRKQLVIAKDTRRVDILGYRISLSQKLLTGTKCYQKLYEIVDKAVKKLEADVGPLTGLPVKMARGIVNRLSSGPEVQKLCAFAVESLDLMLSETVIHVPPSHHIRGPEAMSKLLHGSSIHAKPNLRASDLIQFEDVCSSSLTVILGSKDPSLENVVGYNLWHRKAVEMDYPAEPTHTMLRPNTKFSLSGLTPATKYVFKVVCFDSTRDLGICEVQLQTSSAGDEVPNSKNMVVERSNNPLSNSSSLSNPSSVEDETNNIAPCSDENENRQSNSVAYCKNNDKIIYSNSYDNVFDSAGMNQGGALRDSASLSDDEGAVGKIYSIPNSNALDLEELRERQEIEETSTDNGSNTHVLAGTESVPFAGRSEAVLPVTPCKLENLKDGLGRIGRWKPSKKDADSGSGREQEPQARSSSKKRSGDRGDKDCSGHGDEDFEYCVKVVRWLECEGLIENTFRQKFLTWYSLRATQQELRVVKVFIDTLIDDPASLAGQLIDTFSDAVSCKRSSVVPSGFCLKLWH